MTSRAVEITERMAAMARAGSSVRGALVRLPERVAEPGGDVDAVAARARLGGSIAHSTRPLEPAYGVSFPRFVRCLEAGSVAGSDWGRELDDVAASIRDREAHDRAAVVSGAGAALSARTIAFLPLLMLPLALGKLSDPIVAVSVVVGLALGYSGYRWLMRIVPRAPDEDPAACFLDEVAGSLAAGMHVDRALRDAASRRSSMRPLVKKVDLGARWVDVLSDGFPAVGEALTDIATGVPVETSLRRAAREIRGARAQAFHHEVERAPVKMIVPLVCCILPSFILVAIVPLMRGLTDIA